MAALLLINLQRGTQNAFELLSLAQTMLLEPSFQLLLYAELFLDKAENIFRVFDDQTLVAPDSQAE